MVNIRTKAARIRLYLLGAVLAVVLALGWTTSYLRAEGYRRQLEYTYLRSLQELSGYVTDISNTLGKHLYATTPQQVSALSTQLYRDAGSAKAALSALPVTEFELSDTYRFLSQVGAYSQSLSGKLQQGIALTPEETERLQTLSGYARSLSRQIGGIEQRITGGDVDLDAVIASAERSREEGALPQGEEGDPLGLAEVENTFEGYPTLIYDGPFSDHLLTAAPKLLEGCRSISLEQAQRKAALAAGVPPESLHRGDDERSLMESYTFENDQVSVGITQLGGYITYITNGRSTNTPPTLTAEEAVAKAEAHLMTMGIFDMQDNYYEIANGVCTVNMAYTAHGVTHYPDLIKVGVAMDTGEVVAYDGRAYITNHRERSLPEPVLTPEQAAAAVSPRLRVRSSRLALIPTAGMQEVLTYELRCLDEEGRTVLVYIDAQTGAEAQILLLVEDANGTLTV